MVVAAYFNKEGQRERGIWKLSEKVFRQCVLEEEGEIICCLPLKVSGKTYSQRQGDLHETAVEWSYMHNEIYGYEGDLSMGELLTIQDFFEKNGKRYGLLKEFRNEAIC